MTDIKKVNTNTLAERGQKIYDEVLRNKLEPDQKGKIVAIDPDTKDYFIGDSTVAALEKARKKYPHKVFYLVRVGYRAVHVHR